MKAAVGVPFFIGTGTDIDVELMLAIDGMAGKKLASLLGEIRNDVTVSGLKNALVNVCNVDALPVTTIGAAGARRPNPKTTTSAAAHMYARMLTPFVRDPGLPCPNRTHRKGGRIATGLRKSRAIWEVEAGIS